MADPKNGSTPSKDDGTASPRDALAAALLHAHVDRELDAAGRAALERTASLDPMVRRRIEGLLEVRELVREAVAEQTPAIDSDALWSAVEAGIGASSGERAEAPAGAPAAERARPALRALPGGKQDAAPAADPAVRRRRLGAAFIGIAAIAAVAVLALRGTDGPGGVATLDPGADAGGGTVEAPRLASGGPARTEVLEVDFGTNIGTIFAIEGDEGDRYAVVWLDEGEAPSRDARPESAPGPAMPAPAPN